MRGQQRNYVVTVDVVLLPQERAVRVGDEGEGVVITGRAKVFARCATCILARDVSIRAHTLREVLLHRHAPA